MQIFYEPVINKNLSIALGFFDGVHCAHREILKKTVFLAKENNLKSAVITFKKSPGGYFEPRKNINLQTLDDRLELISKSGIDYAYVLDFNDYKYLSAKEYLFDILIKNFNPNFIVTGFNHTFGANKQGNSLFLQEHQGTYKYIEIEKMRLNNTLISSTNIKKFIEKGYIKEANELLGYEFNISGKVIQGLKIAGELGFKTANINWSKNVVMPPFGVYLVNVEYNGTFYPGAANFGVKPTIKNNNMPVLEVHILNFNKNIYNENIRVYFKAPIRPEKKFNSIKELQNAILDDIEACKAYFSAELEM